MDARKLGANIEHPSRRLVVTLPTSYADATAQYEMLVPAADFDAFAALSTWDAVVNLARRKAPNGFMRYHQIDMATLMRSSGAVWNATQYLMGNHTIAARMFVHEPSVMLHAPLRVLLFADRDGTTKIAVDQPSLIFDSYRNSDVSAVGTELDRLVSGLIMMLGGEVPAELAEGL